MADEDVDPVTKKLKEIGCLEINTKLQECMFEYKDWRKCQPIVQQLKECMQAAEEVKQLRAKANQLVEG